MITVTANRRAFRASLLVWTGAAALFLLPAIAMQFTPAVRWTARDFTTWAAMLTLSGGAFELLSRRAPDWAYRAGAAVAASAAFLLVWINLAVGIIGSEDNGANAMYAGVLAVATGGACLARWRARGMAWAMAATAAAQLLVAAIALIGQLGLDGGKWPADVIVFTIGFTALWLGSAALFDRSAAR